MSVTRFDLIPVILVYVVILAIIIAAIYLVSRMGRQIKLGYWALGGYGLILIGAAIVYTFIPTDDLAVENELLSDDEQWTDIRHRIAYRGEPLEDLEEYKLETWAFDVNLEETMNILPRLENYYFPILIKEVENEDNINLSLYYDKTSFDTEVVEISMMDNELRIDLVLQQLYEFAFVTKDFPFMQLSGDGEESMNYFPPHIYTGEFVLYMEVPADLNLDIAPHTDYEYID